MNLEEKLKSVPNSYEDFVRFTMQCVNEQEGAEEAVLEQLRIKPDSDTQDIMKVLCGVLNIGKPLEIMDDEPKHRISAAML